MLKLFDRIAILLMWLVTIIALVLPNILEQVLLVVVALSFGMYSG